LSAPSKVARGHIAGRAVRAAARLALAAFLSSGMARASDGDAPADSVAGISPGAAADSAAAVSPPAPPDTTATPGAAAPPDSAAAAGSEPAAPSSPKSRGPRFDPGLDRDRVEIGAGPAEGYFDAVGALGYRRYVRERSGWAQFAVGELSGANKDYLSEGTASVYYFFRNRRTFRPEWRIRPILEGGPGVHLAVQSAHLSGFSERPFHAKVFLKAHAYAGVEALVTPRVGFLVRGRLSVPEHRPLDYAQAAIFFR